MKTTKKDQKNKKNRQEELERLRKDIDIQIMMTDDKDELLLLANMYLVTAKNIISSCLGDKKTKIIIQDFVDGIKIV
jgi:hypothetical protein